MRVGLYAGVVASIFFAGAWALSVAVITRFEHGMNVVTPATLNELESVGNLALVALCLLLGASIALSAFGVTLYRVSRSGVLSARVLGVLVPLCAIAYMLLQAAGAVVYAIGLRKVYEAIATLDTASISELLVRYPSAAKNVTLGLALEMLAFVAFVSCIVALATFMFTRPLGAKILGVTGWLIIATAILPFVWATLPIATCEGLTLAAAIVWLLVVSVYLARSSARA